MRESKVQSPKSKVEIAGGRFGAGGVGVRRATQSGGFLGRLGVGRFNGVLMGFKEASRASGEVSGKAQVGCSPTIDFFGGVRGWGLTYSETKFWTKFGTKFFRAGLQAVSAGAARVVESLRTALGRAAAAITTEPEMT
jgi:hypothetical protein